MNGCMLLVLLLLAGQVGQGLPPAQPPIDDSVAFVSTEYGWKINPDTRELEYIVQLAPDKANKMVREDKEFASEIHPDVAVRIRKIVVRIGVEQIESLPLNAVRTLPPVAAPIGADVTSEVGKGKYAQLESGIIPEVKNVAGGAPPPTLPTGGIASSLSDVLGPRADAAAPLPDTVPDALKNTDSLLAQNTIDNFLKGTSGGLAGSSAAGSKFSNTASTPPVTPGVGGAAAPMPGTAGNFPTSTAGIGGGLNGGSVPLPGASTTAPLGSTPGFGQSTSPLGGQMTSATNPGYNTTPNYPTTPGYSTTPNYNTNTAGNGNFGAAPRGTGMQPFNNYQTSSTGGIAQGNFPTTPLTNSPNYGQGSSPYVQHNDPPSYGPATRIADNRTLPTTSGAAVPGSNMATSGYGVGTGNVGTGNLGASASDIHSNDARYNLNNTGVGRGNVQVGYGQGNLNDYQRNGMENVVPVMFVLSLVVNFYLGMLIRKLLGRYRTLLASVRSQTV